MISSYRNVTYCRFKGYRRRPCSLTNQGIIPNTIEDHCDNLYLYNNYYWLLLTCRLIFVLAFEHLVLAIKAIFSYIIPDIPTRIVIQLQRERYLARQAILRGSEDHNASQLKASSDETTDTDNVAYQTGKEALEGQRLEPSSALKRIFSNRRRPSLSPHASNQNLDAIGSSPTLNRRRAVSTLLPDRHVFYSDTESFQTANEESLGKADSSASLSKMI